MARSGLSFKFLVKSILIFFIFTNNSIAQLDEVETDFDPTSQNLENDSSASVLYLKSSYFILKNFLDTITYKDTVLTDNFPYFDPVDSCFIPTLSNGNIGSASMQMPGHERTQGMDPGIHIYDLYDRGKEDFQWNISNYPFTQIFGTPSSTYENFLVGAKFFRNFKDVNFGIDYNRINNKGNYNNQDTKQTYLNLGIWKGNFNTKWNTFFNFLVNVHEEEQNGGVEYIDSTIERISNTTILSNALIRTDNYEFCLNQFYRLKDSTTILGFKPYLRGQLGYRKGFFKFYDDDVSQDSSYYHTLWTDEDGLRNYFNYNSIFSTLGVYGIFRNKSNISMDAQFRRNEYKIESLDNKIANLLILNFHSKIILFNRVNSEIEAAFYVKNEKPEYRMSANFNFDLSLVKLNAGIESTSTNPSLLEQTMVISQKLVYQNDFKNIWRQSLYADLIIPLTSTKIHGRIQNINNYIYHDSELLPTQINQNIQLLEAYAEQKLRFSIYNFDNTIYYYRSSTEKIPLPQYIWKSKLYIHATLFKKILDLYTGFEFNYWDKYYNYGFNPAIANYYVQNDRQLDNFQRLDYYLSGKIGDFRIFLRINNILYPLDNKIYYQVIDYPKYDLFYRIGIKWTLLD